MHVFLTVLVLFCGCLSAGVERRAAIDIGSGSTKVAIADVESDSQQIIQIIHETAFPVPYQAALDKSADGSFDEETEALGLKTFQEIAKLAETYQVNRIAAIATSAFRKANNSKQFVSKVEQLTQIPIRIISQREEGEIAFFSAVASGYRPEEIIVWDIGTGSLQMTTLNEKGDVTVYMGEEMGAVAFKSYIIDSIQERSLETVASPNPMDDDDFYFASRYARAFARSAYPLIKQKIQSGASVVGIGRLFYHSVRPIGDDHGSIKRAGLRHYIISALNKNDQEINNPFAHVDVTNCILVLSIMKALHIHEIHPVNTTSTKGMLIYKVIWSESIYK